jgi:hypothetical protein
MSPARGLAPLVAVALASLAAAAPPPAAAAPAMQWEQRVTREERTLLNNVHIFAACLAQRRPQRVVELLATPIGSRRQRQVLNAIASSEDCIRGSIAVSPSTLRGALAERLVENPEAAAAAAALGGPPRDGPDFASFRARHAQAAASAFSAAEEALVAARWAAGCAARGHPEQVAQLLAAQVASPDEYRRLEALSPVLANCAPSARWRADRHEMRAMLAEAAYANAPTPAHQPR